MKTALLAVITFFLADALTGAQPASPAAAVPPQRLPDAQERLHLATSNGAYPVTPGDAYRLTFQQGQALSALEIMVGSDYTIQLNVFGTLNAAGMTFVQVKQTIEKAFAAAYPRSIPSLSISSVGVFQVFVKGETQQAQLVEVWGMSRLSDLLEGRLGPYSSLRDIMIVAGDGKDLRYDLFQFYRSGDPDQNPYIKAGDTIVISSSERTVEVNGEVKRPGKYQLLSSDQLKEAVDFYGGGLTTAADVSRVKIDRVAGKKAQTLYVDISAEDSSALLDGDSVRIPSKTASLPIVFFEGAVIPAAQPVAAPAQPAEAQGLFTPVSYNRISYSFREGDTLKSALVTLRTSLSPMANLSGAFLIRAGNPDPIPFDLAALLSGVPSAADAALMPLDRIVIPSSQFFVAVYGDVTRPGNYPFTPSRTYRYYADLAGFGDVEEIPQNIVIIDSSGKRRALGDLIEPGSRMYLTAARVTVQGAVMSPGNFTYRKDYSYLDYENLAGGFDPQRSTGSRVMVFDSKGKSRKPMDAIQPGDRIFVDTDRLSFTLNRDLPLFMSIITAVTSAVTVYALLR